MKSLRCVIWFSRHREKFEVSAFPHVLILEVRGTDAEPSGWSEGKGKGEPWVSRSAQEGCTTEGIASSCKPRSEAVTNPLHSALSVTKCARQRPTGKDGLSKTSTDPCFCPEAANLKAERK